MENKKAIERFQDDIKILNKMIRRERKDLQELARENGEDWMDSSAVLMLEQGVTCLKKARRWIKACMDMKDVKRMMEEEKE